MFRKMRRFVQELPQEEVEQILIEATSGVLAVQGDDGYPYAVPVSFVYHDGNISIHSAVSGHKVDAMADCDKVSFCIIGQDIISSKERTSYYKSVIAFGRVRKLTDPKEKREVGIFIGEKYSKDNREEYLEELDRMSSLMNCYEIQIEHITGKESMHLTRQRNR